MRGALWGAGGTQALDAIFNVDERGSGTIGPLYARSGRGSLYARIALDHVSAHSIGLMEARDFPVPSAKGALSATLVGSATTGAFAVGGNAKVTGSWGVATAHGSVAMRKGALHGAIFGNLGSEGSVGATVGGTPSSPRVAGTVVIAGGRYRNFDVNGNAGLAYENGTLNVRDAAVAIGPLFVAVAGTIDGLSPRGPFAPRYDLAAQLHSSDVSSLVATIAPQKAALVQGSIDADLRVGGRGTAPSFAGRVNAPEGSINGLSFRDFAGSLSGDASALTLAEGHVVVGSSVIALSGSGEPCWRGGRFDRCAADRSRRFQRFLRYGRHVRRNRIARGSRAGSRHARAFHKRKCELFEFALPAHRPRHRCGALEHQ